jgi:hypothetical protein
MDGAMLFDAIQVEVGPQAYAEPFAADTLLKMPANALVNLGYLVVAAYWLGEVRRWAPSDPRQPARPWVVAMALLGAVYAPVQFTRIVTQARWSAILDQWVTLPFFALVIAWNLARLPGATRARTRRATAALLVGSTLSYGLAAVLPMGFVLALAVHLAGTVGTSVQALRLDRYRTWRPFALALLSCVAFVVLKEADFVLAAYSPFQRLTGHFWSKIGDFCQLHFAIRFCTESQRART